MELKSLSPMIVISNTCCMKESLESVVSRLCIKTEALIMTDSKKKSEAQVPHYKALYTFVIKMCAFHYIRKGQGTLL